MGLKEGTISSLWGLCIYHRATWSLWGSRFESGPFSGPLVTGIGAFFLLGPPDPKKDWAVLFRAGVTHGSGCPMLRKFHRESQSEQGPAQAEDCGVEHVPEPSNV